MNLRSLVLMHTESNAGFAIAPLESTFYNLLNELGGGIRDSVHFAFTSLAAGHPTNLPSDTPVIAIGYEAAEQSARLEAYVRAHRINFVLAFDAQPTSPLFRRLRSAGVEHIVSYWGAEISSLQPLWKLIYKRVQLALSPAKIDSLIFESQAMANLARFGRGVPERMIDVVPLGIDINRFAPGRTSYAHDTFGIDPERRIVVYAGHMEPRKGVRFLIEAAVELLAQDRRDDVAFLLFGNRPGEEAVFAELYAHLDIAPHIQFAGYRSDLPLCFPGCFLGVIPSSGWDSFPRTAVEFAAAGLPLLVSDLGGLPETIELGRTGLLVPPGDARALAREIRHMLNNPEIAAQMGAASRIRSELNFSSHVQYSRLRDVLIRRIQRKRANS